MAVTQEAINNFIEFCATDQNKAEQYLQHCEGNLEQAVQLYFQTGGNLENSYEGENNLVNELRQQQEMEREQMEVRQRRPEASVASAQGSSAPRAVNRPVVPHRPRPVASANNNSWLQWFFTIFTFPLTTLYDIISFLANFVLGRPLTPVTDPRGDVNNFVASYVEQHVAAAAQPVQHPVDFYLRSYNEAIQEASRSLRPMFVYLQHTVNEETRQFVSGVLHNAQFSALVIAENFLVFGISVNLPEGAKVASILRPYRYPFLSLLLPQGSRMVESIRFEGFELGVQNIIANIDLALNDYRAEMEEIRRQRAEREATRRLREEQEREYEESAKKDRERMQQRRRLESERQEAQERELLKEKQTEARKSRVLDYRKELQASPPAPFAGDQAIRVQVRFPNGFKFEWKFSPDDTLESLFMVTAMQEKCPLFFSIHTTYPRRELHCAPEWYVQLRNEQLTADGAEATPFHPPITFKDAGIDKSVAVAVQDCLA